jgi:DNA-binding SARP family transcriptional activator
MDTKPPIHLAFQQPQAAAAFHVSLLGTFEVRREGRTLPALPAGSQRLLGFLALRHQSITRTLAAGTLWPEASDGHAHASLRSAILRLTRLFQEAIQVTFHELRLADEIAVDILHSRALAYRVLDENAELEPSDLDAGSIAALSADLLPDWYDDWALAEAESWRQLRLHALEALAVHLAAKGRYGEAAGAAIAAIHGEPLRETAHSTLIKIHLAEGNQSEALQAVRSYRVLLQKELGLEPTPQFLQSVRHLQGIDTRPGEALHRLPRRGQAKSA